MFRNKALWMADLVFLAIAAALYFWSQQWQINSFAAPILALNITICIFSVNFAFYQLQASPFRSFLKGLSSLQVILTTAVLSIGMAPILLYVLGWCHSLNLGIAFVPISAMASVVMADLVRSETSSRVLIRRGTSPRLIETWVDDLVVRTAAIFRQKGMLEPEKGVVEPTHEWTVYIMPEISEDDPLQYLISLGNAQIANIDVSGIDQTLSALFDLEFRSKIDEHIEKKSFNEGNDPLAYRIKPAIINYIHRSAKSLCESIVASRNTVAIATAINVLARLLRKRSIEGSQTNEAAFFEASSLNALAIGALELGRTDLAAVAITVFREAAQQGCIVPPIADHSRVAEYSMATYPSLIKTIGLRAIELRSTEFLYRCLDALGWLGCTSAKTNKHWVGKECLIGIIQLGRISRKADLDCFWTRCALDPWQHAEERILWILSWVSTLEEKERSGWLGLIGQSESRLRGFESTLKKTSREGKDIYEIEVDSQSKHVERHLENSREMEFDYSKTEFDRELELWG